MYIYFFVYFWNLLQYLILYVWFILRQCLKIKSCTCERMYLWIFELDTYCFFILLGYSFWNISRSEPCVTLVLNKSCNITSYTWPQSTHKVASSKEKMSQVYLKYMLKHKFQVLLKYISTTSQNTRLKYISSTPQNTSLTSTSQVHKKNNSSTSQVQKHF